jgi:hypothetical protein
LLLLAFLFGVLFRHPVSLISCLEQCLELCIVLFDVLHQFVDDLLAIGDLQLLLLDEQLD